MNGNRFDDRMFDSSDDNCGANRTSSNEIDTNVNEYAEKRSLNLSYPWNSVEYN